MWHFIFLFFAYGSCAYATPHNTPHADQLFIQASHEKKLGNQEASIAYFNQALEADPAHFNTHVQLAKIYYESKQTDLAIEHYKKAADHKADVHLYYNIGQAYAQKEAWQDALEYYQKAYATDPNHEQAGIHAAGMLEKLDKHQDAITFYKKMIAHNGSSFEAYHRLGNTYRHLEDLDSALLQYKKAHELQPKNIQIIMDLANTHNMLEECEQALVLYRTLLDINRSVISALYNFGYTLKKLGDYDNAFKIYTEVLDKKPDYAPALFSRSTIYLARGELERGFEEYEWRWKAYGEKPERYNRPIWEGEDISGKTLLVYAEQGLGDTLQFIRYIKHVKEKINKNIHIVFQTQDPLYDLLKIQPYIDEILHHTQKPAQCHYHIPLMSLARVLKTTLDTIPSDFPYIEPDAERLRKWDAQLREDTNIKVGICWQGNSKYRTLSLRKAVESKSIPLKLLAPLCEIPGISVYSLQQVNGVDQIADCGFADKLHQFDETFDRDHGRFMDTAAVMKQMDVVISVDTASCHLAGALGVPTWIMLPSPPDWRWLQNKTDSVWYPTVRLFHQDKRGDWQSIVRKLVRALQQLALHKQYPNIKKIITHELLKTDFTLKKELNTEQLITHLD